MSDITEQRLAEWREAATDSELLAILDLAERGLVGEARERAAELRGFEAALQVAENCSEHAVVVAAILRAELGRRRAKMENAPETG
jgi:hypothetical protein